MPSKADTRRLDNLVRQIEGRCHHFNGIQHDCCEAGVNYHDLAGPPLEGSALRVPCIQRSEREIERMTESGWKVVECSKMLRTTHEEAVKEAQEDIESSDRHMKAMRDAHADAKQRGLKKGNGGLGEIPCPMDCGGTLKYSVASYNGHMHARCTTNDCVSWME